MCAYPVAFTGLAVCRPMVGYNESGGYVNVHADGSCLRNGRNQPQAGIGVWWNDGHPMNLSEPVQGPKATNIVAELQAVRRAAEEAYDNGITHLRIHTDSDFVIKSFTQYISVWKQNGWRLSNGGPVDNQGEIRAVDDVLRSLRIQWQFVPGHSGNHGNNEADRLARAGAARYRPY